MEYVKFAQKHRCTRNHDVTVEDNVIKYLYEVCEATDRLYHGKSKQAVAACLSGQLNVNKSGSLIYK